MEPLHTGAHQNGERDGCQHGVEDSVPARALLQKSRQNEHACQRNIVHEFLCGFLNNVPHGRAGCVRMIAGLHERRVKRAGHRWREEGRGHEIERAKVCVRARKG